MLSYRGQGRPRNITLPGESLREVRKLSEDCRAFRKARTQLVRVELASDVAETKFFQFLFSQAVFVCLTYSLLQIHLVQQVPRELKRRT